MPRGRPSLSSVLADLPPDAVVERTTRGVTALRGDVVEPFRSAGWSADGGGAFEASDLSGRRPLVDFVAGGERFPVRRFHHGGLLRWMTGRRFAEPARPFLEFALQERLAREGVDTVEVVGARARRAPLWGWELDLVMRRVPDALDGGEALERLRSGSLDEAARRSLFRSAGQFVGGLHARGFVHADLQPRNLLLRRAELEAARPAPIVLDLDGSYFEAELGESQRADNLRRLWRSVERRERRGAPFLRRTDLARFLFAYEPDRARAKTLWRRIAEAHSKASGWHRLEWWRERLGRADVADRDGAARVASYGATKTATRPADDPDQSSQQR